MGRSSGTDIMQAVIAAVKSQVSSVGSRQSIYKDVITAMEDADWDCQQECQGMDPAYDAALKALHPGWDDDEDEDGDISFCITGTLSRPREEYIAQIEDAGFTYKRSVSAGLTYLVLADPYSMSGKAVNARDLGVKTIGEDELCEILEGAR